MKSYLATGEMGVGEMGEGEMEISLKNCRMAKKCIRLVLHGYYCI